MKIFSGLMLCAWWVSAVSAEEAARVPQPRVRLDPVTRTAVAEQAAKVAEGAAQARAGTSGANSAKEAGDASPILMGTYVVKDRATGWFEAPKQETFEGRFTPWKGGKLWAGKLGGTNAEVGFWPYLEFTKPASTAMREGGPRLNVDFLRLKW